MYERFAFSRLENLMVVFVSFASMNVESIAVQLDTQLSEMIAFFRSELDRLDCLIIIECPFALRKTPELNQLELIVVSDKADK